MSIANNLRNTEKERKNFFFVFRQTKKNFLE